MGEKTKTITVQSLDPKFEVFGNYLLLEKITNGGMAAVFLARPAQSTANGRLLAIKRILPQVATDPEFVKMFRSEIQLCMGLNHPNIVQIYDFGHVEQQPFIAMEYIEGRSVRQILTQYGRLSRSVTVGVAASIAAQAAAALHYAHTFKHRVTGEPLNIIHRDVSPQNILVTFDGNVKIIDFGIAKADADRYDATRSGTIKGKVCYLSPEQAGNDPLDGRSDVFALATVLWEMLTGQKLFSPVGRDDLQIMSMIRGCDPKDIIAPSTLNPRVPRELDKIILKGLERKPSDRYENALEFEKALRGFILSYYPDLTYVEVANEIQALFKDEMNLDRERVRSLNNSAQELLSQNQLTRPTLGGAIPDYIPKFVSSGQSNPSISGPTPSGGSSLIAVTQANGQGPAYFQVDSRLIASAVSAQAAQSSILPSVTRSKLLFALLSVSTLWLLETDRQYMLFERFFIPTETIRMASLVRSSDLTPKPVDPAQEVIEVTQIEEQPMQDTGEASTEVAAEENAPAEEEQASEPQTGSKPKVPVREPHRSRVNKSKPAAAAKPAPKAQTVRKSQSIRNRPVPATRPLQAPIPQAVSRPAPRMKASAPQLDTMPSKEILLRSREVFLKVDVAPAPRSVPTVIRVNGQVINSKSPIIRVPMDTKVQVQVDRKHHSSYRNEIVLSSSHYKGPNQTFNLPVKLKPLPPRK